MKILLLGKNGQVGWELQKTLAPLGDVVALDRHGEGLDCGDLEQPLNVVETIRRHKPDVVFNAAAYTAVDKAESETDKALQVNGYTVGAIAQVCAELDCLLVHYSTDYVFDGTGTQAREENAPTAPLNAYGHSKLVGEQAIAGSGCRHLIFRTSWVYGVHGNNFIKTMLRLASLKTEMNVVADQVGAPTSAAFIAAASTTLAQRVVAGEESLCGTYHLVPNGTTNWCEFARRIVTLANKENALPLKPDAIRAIPSTDYPTPANRPLNSRLSNAKLAMVLGKANIPSWELDADRVTNILLSN